MKGASDMKKSDFWCGIVFLLAGLACGLTALCWDTPLDSLLCGFTGALLAPGILQLWKYRKWSRPENAAAYQEKLEQEQIDLRDERKEMLRNKAGRYAYLLGLALAYLAIIVFGLLGKLGVIQYCRELVLFLGVYVLVQYAAGVLIYRKLCEKY